MVVQGESSSAKQWWQWQQQQTKETQTWDLTFVNEFHVYAWKDWVDIHKNVDRNDLWAVWFGAFKKISSLCF